MSPTTRPRGPQLPYQLIAGVEPCPGGWLVVSAKLQGTMIAPQLPEVLARFTDLLDYRPPLSAVALHLPIGLPDKPSPGGRTCDRDARRLLGWPRAAAIASPPARTQLQAYQAREHVEGVSAVTRSLLRRIDEAYEHIASYHQRTIFEVHPELSFLQINENQPLRYPKHTTAGLDERRSILLQRLHGTERLLEEVPAGAHLTHVLDAFADLWVARRIIAHGVSRLPEDPEWDAEGLRMEIVR